MSQSNTVQSPASTPHSLFSAPSNSLIPSDAPFGVLVPTCCFEEAGGIRHVNLSKLCEESNEAHPERHPVFISALIRKSWSPKPSSLSTSVPGKHLTSLSNLKRPGKKELDTLTSNMAFVLNIIRLLETDRVADTITAKTIKTLGECGTNWKDRAIVAEKELRLLTETMTTLKLQDPKTISKKFTPPLSYASVLSTVQPRPQSHRVPPLTSFQPNFSSSEIIQSRTPNVLILPENPFAVLVPAICFQSVKGVQHVNLNKLCEVSNESHGPTTPPMYASFITRKTWFQDLVTEFESKNIPELLTVVLTNPVKKNPDILTPDMAVVLKFIRELETGRIADILTAETIIVLGECGVSWRDRATVAEKELKLLTETMNTLKLQDSKTKTFPVAVSTPSSLRTLVTLSAPTFFTFIHGEEQKKYTFRVTKQLIKLSDEQQQLLRPALTSRYLQKFRENGFQTFLAKHVDASIVFAELESSGNTVTESFIKHHLQKMCRVGLFLTSDPNFWIILVAKSKTCCELHWVNFGLLDHRWKEYVHDTHSNQRSFLILDVDETLLVSSLNPKWDMAMFPPERVHLLLNGAPVAVSSDIKELARWSDKFVIFMQTSARKDIAEQYFELINRLVGSNTISSWFSTGSRHFAMDPQGGFPRCKSTLCSMFGGVIDSLAIDDNTRVWVAHEEKIVIRVPTYLPYTAWDFKLSKATPILNYVHGEFHANGKGFAESLGEYGRLGLIKEG
ncbi:hypothetical protein HDU99_003616 [Rhizoclosmatium hyalinum]|nr:hypothetical protein HDU99_003616 [Rhizoclosmatium hyalinum]